ncbi:MAG TPA: putative toxin-antitoxin system toxin component, PIN family [Cytophagales bacterium]|nr:putative toxin-antitoxin system toxin component, PIN family [Cytophagales bacterium]HAA23181.1 putative toxin-antitoxin system toxin component, PIN family [Cytophagales bacterium]HAP59086.1 putative toxin-antitoxin system toxin component, PIN family [Cytophagales bacterium]
MKVVLDTNVLLISIPKASKFRPILNALRANRFSLAVSNEILMEYGEILEAKMSPQISTNILNAIWALPNIESTQVYYHWGLIMNDPDDNKFVDCAVAANADYLVTNDRHFDLLHSVDFPPIQVVSANQFLELIDQIET